MNRLAKPRTIQLANMTFMVVVLAAGSVVFDVKVGHILGIPFIACWSCNQCLSFWKSVKAHFNAAVSIGSNNKTFAKTITFVRFSC